MNYQIQLNGDNLRIGENNVNIGTYSRAETGLYLDDQFSIDDFVSEFKRRDIFSKESQEDGPLMSKKHMENYNAMYAQTSIRVLRILKDKGDNPIWDPSSEQDTYHVASKDVEGFYKEFSPFPKFLNIFYFDSDNKELITRINSVIPPEMKNLMMVGGFEYLREVEPESVMGYQLEIVAAEEIPILIQ